MMPNELRRMNFARRCRRRSARYQIFFNAMNKLIYCRRVAPLVGLAFLIGVGAFNGPARAAEGDVGPVYIDTIAVIQVAAGGHLAGNMEVKVRGGFTVPTGVVCTSPYITKLKATDADQRMFKLLTIAQLTGKPVRLRISDDSSLQAFGARCSLIWVEFSS